MNPNPSFPLSALAAAALLAPVAGAGAAETGSTAAAFRPPAVPLVSHDPYFSVWSMNDRLTDDFPKHWTGSPNGMTSLVRIDGTTWRLIGPQPRGAEAMEQKSVTVHPTRTVYEFEGGGVALTLTFLTPALPHDLDILSRPVTYLIWEARSADGKPHEVSVYYDCSAELAVNVASQDVIWSRLKAGGLSVLMAASADQKVLARSGDNLRIEWGQLYLAVPPADGSATVIAHADKVRKQFAASGELPDSDDLAMPRPANVRWPVLAAALPLGQVGAEPVARHVLLAYDDQYSIEYLGRRCRPWWRRNGMEPHELLTTAEADFERLRKECEAFDRELVQDLVGVGGEKYARVAALAFRQCLAAHKLVADFDGRPLFFSKENFSNGCIATIDVTYPSSPFFLLFNPELLKAQLTPVLDYARSARWKFPFAPHDLGQYPLANGQVYGGGETSEENQMPVEECGNFLIMLTALAQIDGNADYALQYWPTVTRWAEYLRDKGLDPENQLCTDDFAGHLAHNANLSLKAILALSGYGRLCDMAGKKDDAASYSALAADMARKWMEMADDGDHYRLTFDRPGTWSQKYNLVWDRLLGLNLFPAEVAAKEIAWYKKVQNRYGLPLDSRNEWTKLDWIVWSATLADSREDFDALTAPLFDFCNATDRRVPMTDWYRTTSAQYVGFQARSVVGGVYIPFLRDPMLWKKWSGRAAGR